MISCNPSPSPYLPAGVLLMNCDVSLPMMSWSISPQLSPQDYDALSRTCKDCCGRNAQQLLGTAGQTSPALRGLRLNAENVGPRTFRALTTNCGGVRAALNALPELARRGGATRPIRVASVEEVEKELLAARKLRDGFGA